jgi:hypothetical protein
MLNLYAHHIVDLYCWVDTQVPTKGYRTGRPPLLSEAETITILIWNTIVLKQKTLKDIHKAMQTYHSDDFQLPKYSAFVAHCHRVVPQMVLFLEQLLCNTEAVRLMDATMIPVSKPHRAERHKVAKDIAAFGKNWQGWHYGFKLHASVSLDGTLCSILFTGANIYDAQVMPNLLNQHCLVAVGDTLYGARVMGNIITKKYGTVIIAPPWPTQKRKIATPWQLNLLNQRSKIECVFDYLKEHLHLVSSFPRSLNGYLLHYIRILLSYQVMALSNLF